MNGRVFRTISMRIVMFSVFILLLAAGVLCRAEDGKPFPLWDGEESVAAYARRTNLPTTQSIDLGGGESLKLVLVPAGQYVMGSAAPEKPLISMRGSLNIAICGAALAAVLLVPVLRRTLSQRKRPQLSLARLLLLTPAISLCVFGAVRYSRAKHQREEYLAAVERFRISGWNEKPARRVTISRPFYLGQFEVMQSQYTRVMQANPSAFPSNDLPADSMPWEDAAAFCSRLSTASRTVRLPTEAEWEYACRAGTRTRCYAGDKDGDIDRIAWYTGGPRPVGKKVPNAFSLYDMNGNVWEWCADWYGPEYDPLQTVDPKGPQTGPFHVIRGGSWLNYTTDCTSTARWGSEFGGTSRDVGFRIVLEIPKQK
jgi:hypothetical protein